jgi:Protein of unknown function (DUF5818)
VREARSSGTLTSGFIKSYSANQGLPLLELLMQAFCCVAPQTLSLLDLLAFASLLIMPRGSTHIIEGLLLGGDVYPILRPDGGGQWRLDLPWRYRKMVNRRVRVEGIRSEFDMLDVTRLTAL